MPHLLRIAERPVLRVLDDADDGIDAAVALIPVAEVRADGVLAVQIFLTKFSSTMATLEALRSSLSEKSRPWISLVPMVVK